MCLTLCVSLKTFAATFKIFIEQLKPMLLDPQFYQHVLAEVLHQKPIIRIREKAFQQQ